MLGTSSVGGDSDGDVSTLGNLTQIGALTVGRHVVVHDLGRERDHHVE